MNFGQSGRVTWNSPSNIAIIKYWGKYGEQLPRNASISFTLKNAATQTSMDYKFVEQPEKTVKSFLFEGKEEPAFAKRVSIFLDKLKPRLHFLNHIELDIQSENSFPHSSGIASSASGMSALALCLCSIEKDLYGQLDRKEDFFTRASFIARLGSGSASRSVFPYVSAWGKHDLIPGSDNEFAVAYEDIHDIYKSLHNDILIVSEKKKSVSSSAGHDLMNNNIYASSRYQQAKERMEIVLNSLKNGDIKSFGDVLENEALTLHALMMCSEPSYILFEPDTLNIINEIRGFRKETNIPVYFSLDAGPNIHLMYPDEYAETIKSWIKNKLAKYCVNGKVIEDQVGPGPFKLD